MTIALIPRVREMEEELSLLPPEPDPKSAYDKEQAALGAVTTQRYTNDLELMERLDAAIDAALVRLD
jgi:hypothetical protein